MHLLQNIVRTLRDAHAWGAFGNADYKTTIQKSRIHRKPKPLSVVIEPMSEVSFFEHKWVPQSGVIPAICYVDLEVYKVSLFIKILFKLSLQLEAHLQQETEYSTDLSSTKWFIYCIIS